MFVSNGHKTTLLALYYIVKVKIVYHSKPKP